MAKTKKTVTKQTATRPKGTSATKKAAPDKAPETAPEKVVTMDRRSRQDRRKTPDRRKKDIPVAVERRKIERRAKVNRRRQIDPTTCERDYTTDEIEFMNALDEYKRSSGRMFPTCSEILEVIRTLGYHKPTAAKRAGPITPENGSDSERPTGTGAEADDRDVAAV